VGQAIFENNILFLVISEEIFAALFLNERSLTITYLTILTLVKLACQEVVYKYVTKSLIPITKTMTPLMDASKEGLRLQSLSEQKFKKII
jgi:hypothetical protein